MGTRVAPSLSNEVDLAERYNTEGKAVLDHSRARGYHKELPEHMAENYQHCQAGPVQPKLCFYSVIVGSCFKRIPSGLLPNTITSNEMAL